MVPRHSQTMSSSQQPPGNGILVPALPSGFVSVRDVLDGKIRLNSRVSIVGIITDYRSPISTRTKDWKCQVRFYDLSVQDEDDSSLSINIFRPEKEMPIVNCGDVIVITVAKVQNYQSDGPSLLTCWETKIRTYNAADIPKPPGNAVKALRPSARAKDGQPGQNEAIYISQMFHAIDKDRLPTESEFQLMKLQSANVKDKFGLLEDVQDGRFYDVVAQIVKEPYDMGDKITLWVSDYTENTAFFHYAFGGANTTEGRDGDPYGYTSKFSKLLSLPDWNGPFGKKSLQITCFEPHATAIRESQMSFGTWVSIRNLQIKFGHNASNLEGYLREDRGASGPKLGIWSLDPTDDKDSINPHHKEALRRKRDYERDKKDQLRAISDASKAGEKRRAQISSDQDPVKMNSKRRRNARRARAGEEETKSKEPVPITDLNSQVKCEYQNKAVSLVADILELIMYDTTIDGKATKLQLPFVNTNYRTNVRVVNFMPPKLEDFAYPKQSTEYDVLSDNEELSSESESEHGMMTDFTANRNWEWRFFLQLEDAAVLEGQQKRRFWVTVDNQAAQYLMNLDASNLRHNKEDLDMLRQQLFLLWGDLEEHKQGEEMKKAKSVKAAREGKPPMDSSDEGSADEAAPKESRKRQFTNRPFPCCIRQYGVKVQESDAAKADAGKGRRWQRMFGLFGTRISTK